MEEYTQEVFYELGLVMANITPIYIPLARTQSHGHI